MFGEVSVGAKKGLILSSRFSFPGSGETPWQFALLLIEFTSSILGPWNQIEFPHLRVLVELLKLEVKLNSDRTTTLNLSQ